VRAAGRQRLRLVNPAAAAAPLFLLSLFTCVLPAGALRVFVEFGSHLPRAARLSHTVMGYECVFSAGAFSEHWGAFSAGDFAVHAGGYLVGMTTAAAIVLSLSAHLACTYSQWQPMQIVF
jgi:hypothetical protein